VCFFACEETFVPDVQDPYNCVLDMTGIMPSGFQTIPYTNAEIVKTAFATPTAGICPTGYTKWEANKCYIDCPLNYPDLGPSCLVPSLTRRYTSPTCGNLSYTPSLGSPCILTPWGITMYIMLLLVGIVLVYQLITTKFGIGNSKILNKVQAYLRTQAGVTSVQPPLTLNFFLLGGLILALVFLRG
jgi:hypothetical protein